jgi:osmotically inducible protein OsmC
MALALVLGEADAPPQQLAVTAACTLDEVDGAPRITSVDLTVRGRVAGIDDKTFERHLAAAGELCPVSNALNGNVQVGLQGHLERQ